MPSTSSPSRCRSSRSSSSPSPCLLSGNRRRTVLRTGLGVAFAVALVLTSSTWRGASTSMPLVRTSTDDAAAAVYDQLLEFLRTALRSVFVLGHRRAIGAWLAGPGQTATTIRDSPSDSSGATGRTPDAEPSAAPRSFAVSQPAARLVAGIGVAILVVLSHPGPVAVLTVAVVVAVCLGVVGALGRTASNPQTPHPQKPTTIDQPRNEP